MNSHTNPSPDLAPLAIDPDKLLTEAEAADLLGFTVRALQGWRYKGGGPQFVKINGKSVRYARRELRKWIDVNQRRSTSDTVSRRAP